MRFFLFSMLLMGLVGTTACDRGVPKGAYTESCKNGAMTGDSSQFCADCQSPFDKNKYPNSCINADCYEWNNVNNCRGKLKCGDCDS